MILLHGVLINFHRVNLVICDSNGYVILSVASYTYTHRLLKAEIIIHYDCGLLRNLYMSHIPSFP